MRSLFLVLLLLLLTPSAAPLAAQSGSVTDILTGTVTGAAGEPIAGARVAATSVETGVTRTTTTNMAGRYTLVFPQGGGHYQLQVAALGTALVTRQVVRQADEDVLVAHVRLEPVAVALEGVEVTAARRPAVEGVRREPGSQERVLAGEALERLPLDATDLAQIATLAPGVVSLGGGDSLGLAISVLGQGPAGNQVTLDGLSFGGEGAGLGVPQEAVRFTRVISNSYDVARGQFSGGQIATTTRAGTNALQGSFSYQLRDPALQWTADQSAFGGAFRQNRFSGGVGGPIVRDRLFLFAALSAQRRSQALPSLLSADAPALQRLGVSPDSVAQLLAIVGSRGLLAAGVPAPEDRVGDDYTALGRLDLNLTDAHTLTLRGDARWSDQGGSRVGPLELPQGGASQASAGGGVMASMTSRFGNGWVNELRAYASRQERESEPYQLLPQGRVRVTSALDDGGQGISTLGFGGGAAATGSRAGTVELSNELSLLLGTSHRVRLGGLINASSSSQEQGSNQYGTFTFNSLEALAANRPVSFTRTLTTREREAGGINLAAYLGDSWRATPDLQLTYGLRLERSSPRSEPEHNPEVERLFGRRTDRIPGEVALTPRAGFSYTIGRSEEGPPLGVVRGGVGIFRSSPSWSLFAAARELTGLPDAQAQLTCVGAGVPVPDWAAYLRDPGSIPAACAEGNAPSPRPGSGQAPGVAVFDDGFAAAQSWRASLGFQRRVRAVQASVDVTYARGVNQQGVRDLNLRADPALLLDAERGRPVFVPAEAIVRESGEVGFLASRRHPGFGQVSEVHADLESRTTQVTLGLNGILPWGRILMSGSYSFTRAEDQGSAGGWGFGRFGGGGGGGIGSLPLTAGDPNQPEWARSDFERRHSLSATMGRSLRPWLDLTLIGRASDGSPFTPLVGGDINGDGARNDRAFLFDPATAADPAVAAGMARVLENVPGRVRHCLESQLGRIAGRNSCRSPWSYSLDLRLNLRPELPTLGRRLSVSVDAVNTLAGVDRLVHGEEALRGWGQRIRPDAVLLYPRGFDPATRSFRYEVNERFGTSRSGNAAFRDAFQLQIQAQLQVGRPRNTGGAAMAGVAGFGGGGGGIRLDPAQLMERAFPNPVRRIVERADSLALGLAPEQVARLDSLAAALQQKQDSLAAGVRAAMGPGGRGGDPGAAFQQLQPRLEASRANVAEALAEAQRILTPEQWARVPEPLRALPRLGPGGGVRRR